MSIARHHAEWLSPLEINGPFLSLPVLMRAFPQGLDAPDPNLVRDLRAAYEEWLDNQGSLHPDPAIHRAWIRWVVLRVLEMPERVVIDLQTERQAAARWAVAVPERGDGLPPDDSRILVSGHGGSRRPALAALRPGDGLLPVLSRVRSGHRPLEPARRSDHE